MCSNFWGRLLAVDGAKVGQASDHQKPHGPPQHARRDGALQGSCRLHYAANILPRLVLLCKLLGEQVHSLVRERSVL